MLLFILFIAANQAAASGCNMAEVLRKVRGTWGCLLSYRRQRYRKLLRSYHKHTAGEGDPLVSRIGNVDGNKEESRIVDLRRKDIFLLCCGKRKRTLLRMPSPCRCPASRRPSRSGP
jgi:hypothetical protein